MKYSLFWLKEYLKTEKTAKDLSQMMVELGSDVDDISSFPQIDDKVIAVKITKIEPHPNADRLKLPTISDGEMEVTIVCGAPNIEVGQICCFAQVGAKVRDFEIEEAEIRGIKSPGMLLSPRELEISEDHKGIYILPEDTELGVKVGEILGKDQIFDLEITPNRGDLLSHFGLARDLSAKLGAELQKPELKMNSIEGKSDVTVKINSEKCALYMAREIRGVKVAESPDWLKERLLAIGAKPINNIVDVTNYIMFDLGHPLHAFDKNKLNGGKIEVKEIEKEMDVVTLDGEARAILSGTLGIWDGVRPIAVAGVMGLGNSEVDEKTTDIILEAAVFDRKSIRKTAKLLNLKTEASARFERGIDDANTNYVIDKAAKLIAEIAGGEVIGDVVQAGEVNPRSTIKIEYEKINSYADLTLEESEINKFLENLGFEVSESGVTTPSWRHDISIWQDLAEEVYRINGLDKIKPERLVEMQKPSPSDYHKKEKIKDYLVELGLDEAISYTFLSQADVIASKLDPSDLLEVANPVQDENRYLRNSLIPGLLKAVSKNPSFDDIELFEIGSVFSKSEEWFSLGIATSGKSARNTEKIVELLCERFGFDKEMFKIYKIEQEELKRFKIKKPSVMVAEAKIPEIIKSGKFDGLDLTLNKEKVRYRPISKFPSVKRDLAFVVETKISSDDIKESILELSQNVILVELFDEFESDKLGSQKKSVAFHVWLEDEKKTLSDQEADGIISKIVEELKEKFGAKLRN
jgi:phenylalanyl-tRNA synthetase beta chain